MIDYCVRKFPHATIYFTHHLEAKPDVFSSDEKINYRVLDLSNSTHFNDICLGIDFVIHLAFPNEIICGNNVQNSILNGEIGTYLLLEDALKHKVKKFIFLSTIHVYGDLNRQLDNLSPTEPIHPYGSIKCSAEFHVEYFRNKGLNTLILRLSNGFGSPYHKNINRHNLLFNDVCNQALSNGEIRLSSNGKKKLDFFSFSFLFKELFKLIEEDINQAIINFGSGNPISILEFVNKIRVILEKKHHKKTTLLLNENDKSEVNDLFYYKTFKTLNNGEFDEYLEKEVELYLNYFNAF